MNVFDQIGEDIKKAMLAHDNVTRDALRNVKKEFLEAKTAKGGTRLTMRKPSKSSRKW